MRKALPVQCTLTAAGVEAGAGAGAEVCFAGAVLTVACLGATGVSLTGLTAAEETG